MGDRDRPSQRSPDPAAAAARPRAETTTLVFAVTLAVALGVACGVWINSRLASAASATRAAAPSRLTAVTPAPATGPTPDRRDDTPRAADAGGTLTAPPAPADAGRPGTEIKGATGGARGAGRDDARPTPVAREASPPPKVEVSPGTRWEVVRRASEGVQGRAKPCALYASAVSLTLRGGGAAPLLLGGPGEDGRVTLTTPDWANIAVLYEGRTGNGWSRYSVRSVSGRPGVYTLRHAAPCGSQKVTVTVK